MAGTVVIELAGIGPAPFAGMMFADLGAQVIRVDRLPRPEGPPAVPALNNRGKQSIAVDLKSPEGVDIVRKFIGRADVLIEGFRPGVAERLGLGPDDCLALNPRLVYGRVTGWGQHGPLAHTAGHDIDYLAITGVLSAIGRAGGPPQIPLNLLGDFAAGSLYLVVGVLAALIEARSSGQGQVVDAAIVDGACHLSSMILELLAVGAWRDERGVNALDSGACFYDVYLTADDEYLAVGAVEPQFFAEFVGKLGIADRVPDLRDPEAPTVLRRLIEQGFRQRTRQAWLDIFEGSDACVAPVLSWREAAQHPHLRARSTFVPHGDAVQAAPAPRFSRTTTRIGPIDPIPGQHTKELLAALSLDVEDLQARHIVHQHAH